MYLLGERTIPFSFSVPEDIGGEEARAAASEAPSGPMRGAERPHTPSGVWSQKMRMQICSMTVIDGAARDSLQHQVTGNILEARFLILHAPSLGSLLEGA